MRQLLWGLLHSRWRLGGSIALGKTEFFEYFPPMFLFPFLCPFSFSGPISPIPSCQPQVCPAPAISAPSWDMMSINFHIGTMKGFGPCLTLTYYVPVQEVWAGVTVGISLWGPFCKGTGCVTQDESVTISSSN